MTEIADAVAHPVLGEEAPVDREADDLGGRSRAAAGEQVHLVEHLERDDQPEQRASRRRVGSIIGNVTWRSSCQALAPSTRAAS